jgi:hypothetical protein
MRTEECLTIEEENALRTIYRRDVKFWGWHHWCCLIKKFGEGPMGFVWVLLPYKPELVMPSIRRRINEIYYSALEDEAWEYGLKIKLDDASNKLILFQPQNGEGGEQN